MSDDVISKAWKVGYWLTCFAIFAAFVALGQSDRGVVGAFCFASVALAARVRWDLRNELWYRAMFLIVIIVHITALFAIDWHLYVKPTILYAPLVIVDFAVILSLTFVLEKSLQKSGS